MRSRRHLACAVLVALPFALVAPHVRAQSASTTGTATVLFDEAVALMGRGDFAQACPKLARSNELSPNGGTLFALAECYERSGKLASAWVTYKEAAIRARGAKREDAEKQASESADRLAVRVSRLSIQVPPPAAIDGLTVELDGRPVARAEWGVATPIDPGSHKIAIAAKGRVPSTIEVVFDRVAAQKVVTVPVLELEHTAQALPPPAGQEGAPRGRTQRIAGVVLGGVGLAGLAVGTVFGLQASSKNDEAASHCSDNRCTADGIRLDKEGRDAATVSTIAFIAGGTLAAAGLVLVLSAPSGRETQPTAIRSTTLGVRGAPGGASFTFGATF